MAEIKYAFKGYNKETMAKVAGRDLSLSTKDGIEICNFIRNKKLSVIKDHLGLTIKELKPIPFKRFMNGHGHRKGKGLASGRYPVKASGIFLDLLQSAEANALSKGLSANNLKIVHALTNVASRPFKSGRIRGEMKRSHVEIVLEEVDKPKRDVSSKKTKAEKPVVEAEPKKDIKAEPQKAAPAEKVKEVKPETKTQVTKTEPAKAEQAPAKTKVEVKDKKEEAKPEPKPEQKTKVTVTDKNEDTPKK